MLLLKEECQTAHMYLAQLFGVGEEGKKEDTSDGEPRPELFHVAATSLCIFQESKYENKENKERRDRAAS